MNSLMKSLYVDLHNRLKKMIDILEARNMQSPAASDFKKQTIVTLSEIKGKINITIESGILEETYFIPNLLTKFGILKQMFIEVELFQYLPILKYDERAEGYFQKIIQEIYREIKTAQKAPLVCTISNSDSYYWVYSNSKVIALPQGEENHLLNLSDLYHEIGHLLFEPYDSIITDPFSKEMKQYYQNIKKGLKAKEKLAVNKIIRSTEEHWMNSWIEEISCDLIATYLVGTAYAWSNMKITVPESGTNKMYSSHNSFQQHPPHETRMRCILAMLHKTNFNVDLVEINKTWEDLLKNSHRSKHKTYDLMFPDELINLLTTIVFGVCQDDLLLSYPQQLEKNTAPISKIINDAWKMILRDPINYSAWEFNQIENLQSLPFV